MRPIFLILLLLPGLARADAFRLAFPVDCTLGETCFVQNYVDRDPGPGRQDIGCGHLTYDGHTGTDIALLTEAELGDNTAIRPVAPGVVHATRDGMPDILASDPAAPDLTNRSCGNAVVINHDDGWQSTYCHLQQGSVAVRSGDKVTKDTLLGAIGLSGRTDFPHLHLTLRKDGEVVDPFRPNPSQACNDLEGSLWPKNVSYLAAGFLTAGAAEAVPNFADIKAGRVITPALPNDAPAMVFWAHYFGPKAGDTLRLTVTGPRGPFLRQEVTLDRDQVRAFRALGRKRGNRLWTEGAYVASFELARDGRVIDTIQTVTQVTR